MMYPNANFLKPFPDYAFNHPLFTDKMRIYSDSKVSEFINSITRDQSFAFLSGWNEKQDHKQKIYICYDSTNKNCQAGDHGFYGGIVRRIWDLEMNES